MNAGLIYLLVMEYLQSAVFLFLREKKKRKLLGPKKASSSNVSDDNQISFWNKTLTISLSCSVLFYFCGTLLHLHRYFSPCAAVSNWINKGSSNPAHLQVSNLLSWKWFLFLKSSSVHREQPHDLRKSLIRTQHWSMLEWTCLLWPAHKSGCQNRKEKTNRKLVEAFDLLTLFSVGLKRRTSTRMQTVSVKQLLPPVRKRTMLMMEETFGML